MLTTADIQRQTTLAWCCLGKRMGDALSAEKRGQRCEGDIKDIGYGFLYLNATEGYIPEGSEVRAYTQGCQMNFAGNQFIVNSRYVNATDTFYEMYDAINADVVGQWVYFDADGTVYVRDANGVTSSTTWVYDPVAGTLDIGSGTYIYEVTYDKFFENIYLTDVANGYTDTYGFYGTKTLIGCTEVSVVAEKPCLGVTQIQGLLNKASKSCDCNCEDYVTTEPTSKYGESLYLSDVEFNCLDGVVYMTITFHYSGSPIPNSFGVYVNGGIVYTFSDTGSSSGSFISTVTSAEIAALPQNASYDVTIYDNYGTTYGYASNTIESIPLNACVAPELCCEVCDLEGGQFFVSAMNINGVDYNLLNPPPSPFNAYMGTYITFLPSNLYTWQPITSDSPYTYEFDCASNVATLETTLIRELAYLSIDFNCSASAATAYILIEDSLGNPTPVILTLQVSQDFTKDCTGECCNITSLSGLTMESVALFNFTGPDQGYVPLPAPGNVIIKLEFTSASSVNSYEDGVLTGTYNYTYDPMTGELNIDSSPDPANGFLQLTCNCSRFIFTIFNETSLLNIYFELI